jgi:broad specificity phosphatase PhoE
MRSRLVSVALVLCAVCVQAAQAQATRNYLADNTVLIVRHAEKPANGTGLTPTGEARARLYAKYFEPFQEDGLSISIDCLYAGADSKNSVRPRLTLEPLSKASGLPLHTAVGTKNPEALVLELRSEAHGRHPLIAWRHGEIPSLLTAFGADPATVLPGGKWPDDVFDWVIVLTTGPDGQPLSTTLIHEKLSLPAQ